MGQELQTICNSDPTLVDALDVKLLIQGTWHKVFGLQMVKIQRMMVKIQEMRVTETVTIE